MITNGLGKLFVGTNLLPNIMWGQTTQAIATTERNPVRCVPRHSERRSSLMESVIIVNTLLDQLTLTLYTPPIVHWAPSHPFDMLHVGLTGCALSIQRQLDTVCSGSSWSFLRASINYTTSYYSLFILPSGFSHLILFYIDPSPFQSEQKLGFNWRSFNQDISVF